MKEGLIEMSLLGDTKVLLLSSTSTFSATYNCSKASKKAGCISFSIHNDVSTAAHEYVVAHAK